MTLTESQKKAVQKADKNILVSAGAGTGKTRVLVERILHLLRTQKTRITELLVLTFTEKAANEIKSRLLVELRRANLEQPRRDLEQAAISTFHSFASRLLKEHPIEAGVDPDFRVIETEQSELLKEEALQETIEKVYETKQDAFELLAVYGEESMKSGVVKVFAAARHEGKRLPEFFMKNEEKRKKVCQKREDDLPREAEVLIGKLDEIDAASWKAFLKNTTWDWDKVAEFRKWSSLYGHKRKEGLKEWRELLKDLAALRIDPLAVPWQRRFEDIALGFERCYEAKKKEKGFLDFDDLQMKAVALFAGGDPISLKLRERYQKKYKFILIDEFQDTNFLQMQFAELLSSGKDLFMVGDYKQSIYGFRGAEPGIFFEKEELYRDGTEGERIFLSESFRSEPAVVDFVNRFFKVLWEEDGFSFEPLMPIKKQTVKEPAVEVLVTEVREDEEKEHARMREARGIALRIRELHEKGVPYGDIAILFQAMTVSGIYEDALKAADIPYFIVAGRGFYEQPEIQDMVSFLTHLEKPLSDIPLAATLRSPLFHITDDTLFWLSHYAKEKNEVTPLYHALKKLGGIREIPEDQKKQLIGFVTLARELSSLKDRVPLAALIDKILERTGYELSVLADPSGVRRFANLKKLMAIVREYETYERMPLAVFLKILQRLQAQEVIRESEAQIALETGAEAVRMMSVHAAKGLEFEVVFVADMGHQGRYRDSKTVIAHATDGYGMRVRNKRTLDMEEPYFYKFVDREIKAREDKEWKRLFYVAVTRAKARLFLSGVYKEKDKKKEFFSEMTTWMDWVMALGGRLDVLITKDADKKAGLAPPRPVFGREKITKIIKSFPAGPHQNPIPEIARPLPRTIDLPVSAYVLFQKNPQAFWRTYQIGWVIGENEWTSGDAMFADEDVSAADFGTAMHTFLEHWDFQELSGCQEAGFLEGIFSNFGKDAVAEARKLLQGFMQSLVFKQLQKAKRIEREIEFVLNARHGVIRGKIDMLFEDEKGEWHILDYKTAVGDKEAVQKSAYDLQMEIYALAVQKILSLPVRSAVIYYFKNQTAVTIPFPLKTDETFFGKLEKKISDLQEKLLDYSNDRIQQQACVLKPVPSGRKRP